MLNLSAFGTKEETTNKSNLNYSAFGASQPAIPKFDPTGNTPKPQAISINSPSSFSNSKSTPQTNSTGNPLDLVKETAQAFPRTTLSLTADMYNAATRKDPNKFKTSLTPDDLMVTPGFLEALTGTKEIKPLSLQIAENTSKVKDWQNSLPDPNNPDLNTRERIVLDVLKNLSPEKLAFAGVVGDAGLNLTPFGGGEEASVKGLLKTMVKTTSAEEALILGRRIGIADDLLDTFVHGVVKSENEKQAQKFLDDIVNLQKTTKVSTPNKKGMVLLHGGPKELKGGKLNTGMGVNGDAGGIFFTPDTETGKMYARSYTLKGSIKTGEGKIHRVELSPEAKIFDATNPEDINKLRPLISEQGVKDIITTSRNGTMDWATGSQYFDQIKEAGFDGAKLSERPAGFELFDESGKLKKTKEDAISYVVFDNKKFEMLPDELPQLPKIQNPVSEVDRYIAEGKIRVKSLNNRDVYEYKKGDTWQRARDEDGAVKAVTPEIKPVNFALEEKKLELEFKKEALKDHPAQGLTKYVSKKGEHAGELPEVLGNTDGIKKVRGNAREFMKRGDSIVTEKGFAESEKARASFEDFKKRSEEVENLKSEVKDMSKADASKKVPSSRLGKEEVRSLEESAQQTLDTVDEPFVKDISPLKKMVTDTNTPVKEKVNMLDYFRTPDRVLKKIGLGDVANQLRTSYDNYVKEIPVHLQIITDWSKEVPKESNQKIFKWLDGQTIALNAKEMKVASEIKQYLEEWAFRLGLPEDNQISHYITHLFDFGVNEKEFDEEVAKIIKDQVPGSVYDPFLEKRLGKKGYLEDTWQALDAYVKRAVRKSNMDPALEQMKRASVHLEESQLNYVQRLGSRINMRPTEWDNLLDNTIKQIAGYRFGQRPTAYISGTLRKMVYRGALGLNINSAVKNLTQGVNTFAKLGVRDTLMGYTNLLKPGMGKELEESGILRAGFIQDRTLSATKQMLQRADKGLFAMFELAEKINRGSAYFGAKASAVRKGLSEEQAVKFAKETVRDTQFQFGAIDTPVAMQGDIAKTLLQFGSFSQKQIEFLTEMASKKEWAGIVRYIVASTAIVYTVGQVFNIKAQDFNPLNYFSRFGKPPSLALPISIVKAVTNMPDQYGKTPTTNAKIKDIIYSGKTLVPAGVQLDKFFKGQIIGGSTTKSKKKTNSKLPKLPSVKSKKQGLPKLPKIPKL